MTKDTLEDMQILVLGTVLARPDRVGVVVAGLQDDDFQNQPGLQLVFSCIRTLYVDGSPVNALTIQQESTKYGAGEALWNTLALLSTRSTAEPLEYYIATIRDAGQLRRMQAEAMRLCQADSLEDAMRRMDTLNALGTGRENAKVSSISDALAGILAEQDAPRPDYIRTGLPALDRTLLLSPGRFVGLGGYPSSGKTLLAMQMALTIARTRRVGFFSLETDQYQMAQRAAANLSGVSMRKIMEHNLNAADRAGLETAAKNAQHLQLEIVEAAGWSVQQLRAMTLARKYDVVFVDYLQLLDGPGRDRYDQVTRISMALHTFAQQDLPGRQKPLVIALAQLARPDKLGGKPVPPSMSSFRESGQIEQDLDAALILYTDNPNDNCGSSRVLKLAKNKTGELGQWLLRFDGVCQRMEIDSRPMARQAAPKSTQQSFDFYTMTADGMEPPAGW